MEHKHVKLLGYLLYRDNGLVITPSSPRLQEKLKQRIIKIFGDQGLKITIDIGLTRANFLDIPLDLETGLYKPFRKPGDKPLYISAYSKHPPQIMRLCAREFMYNLLSPHGPHDPLW